MRSLAQKRCCLLLSQMAKIKAPCRCWTQSSPQRWYAWIISFCSSGKGVWGSWKVCWSSAVLSSRAMARICLFGWLVVADEWRGLSVTGSYWQNKRREEVCSVCWKELADVFLPSAWQVALSDRLYLPKRVSIVYVFCMVMCLWLPTVIFSQYHTMLYSIK